MRQNNLAPTQKRKSSLMNVRRFLKYKVDRAKFERLGE